MIERGEDIETVSPSGGEAAKRDFSKIKVVPDIVTT